jgi:hypothetical protein
MRKIAKFICIAVCIPLVAVTAPAQEKAPTAARERVWGTGGAAAGPAQITVTLNESFLNAFFEAMFTNLRKPSYPLTLMGGNEPSGTQDRSAAHAVRAPQCANQIVLEREVAGVKTEVHFRDGRIEAPLAFSGSYPLALVGCLDFSGWADATVVLTFDQARQSLTGRVTINSVHLSGVPNLTSGVVTSYVQSTLDRKINPIEILRADQLSALIPVKPAGGSLRLRAREVIPEVMPGELRLRINYEFVKGE